MDGEAMTTQPNLRDVLNSPREMDPITRQRIETWAFGEVRECETCGGTGRIEGTGGVPPRVIAVAGCLTCHGTGEVRGPGFEQRVLEGVEQSIHDRQGYAIVPGDIARAIREELGTP